MKTEKTDVFELRAIAREVKLPLWYFLVAEGIRKPVEYSDFYLAWFMENNDHISNLGFESEEYYALRKRLEFLLLPLAEAAESEEEFNFVLEHSNTFDNNIKEIIWVKKRKSYDPEGYNYHVKSLQGENARRLVGIELSETEVELRSFVPGVTAELPRFDTATELAVKKMIRITSKLSTLKWLDNMYFVTQIDWRFDIARRIVELKKTRELEM